MRKKLFLGAVAATALVSWAAKDAVLMKVNGDKIKLSEFEYLYHKNNQQQIEKESLDKYLERFIVYKLKVADAKAAGIDTTSAFKNEFVKYRNDLAQPYMVDSATIDRLLHEAYDRKMREVEVAHIMLSLDKTNEGIERNKQVLDSIRTCILNGEDMGALAEKYSIDRSAKKNHGNLGYIVSGRFPYAFEKMAYETKIGDISAPFTTDFGVHIVKPLADRPSRGEVLVEHILKLYPRGANDSVKAAKLHEIEVIYDKIQNGADFEETAKKESEDPGSARNGGKLQWFGSGMMVPEFEQVAFTLNKGELSKPFETAYGVHIIKKLDSRQLGSFDDNKATLMNVINSDERSTEPRVAKIQLLKEEYKLKENDKFFKMIEADIATAPYDSLFVERMKNYNCVAFSFAKTKVMAAEVAERLNPKAKLEGTKTVVGYVKNMMARFEEEAIVNYEREQLAAKYPEYANLLNEYYNGMMLFEISNRNVWDKANRDREGLEQYFQANKSKYQWKQPKFKGMVIYTTNDSVQDLVKEALKDVAPDSVVVSLKKQFKRDVRIERLLVEKGENAVVDELVFGGKKATPKDKRYTRYFMYEGKILDQPEEAADVRGQVTSDYQMVLEEKWIAELKQKYPVEVNYKVLKKVK